MGINNTLLSEIEPYLSNYSVPHTDLESVLSQKAEDRAAKAIGLVEQIMSNHGKEGLCTCISKLYEIESSVYDFNLGRDHVSHTIQSFILGIYINEYIFRANLAKTISSFEWKLACLFHDIGYQLEIPQKMTKYFSDEIENLSKFLEVPDINIGKSGIMFNYGNLLNLSRNKYSLDLIQTRLDEWKIDIDVKKTIEEKQKAGEIDHGIISSLVLLKLLDSIYTKYNPEGREGYIDVNINGQYFNVDQKNFDKQIVSACSAIFIHNISCKISHIDAPLAYLLKLSDNLQCWERPGYSLKDGVSSDLFDIKVFENSIIYTFSGDEKTRGRIIDDLNRFYIKHTTNDNEIILSFGIDQYKVEC